MKFITAKFNSRCAETGKAIKKGDSMLYDYSARKCYSRDSETFKKANTIDAAAGMIQANEEAEFDNFCYNNNI